ncbi:tRNA (N(6)-L-threonylcarbamoyladenosine(37)-C(2))-methylthiotransferase MtaB [Halarsenatibacter silvermanii]|uniref:Threonylcarbamoyladenosine tRNA methylthiotransferase MtaB n=1 Tax=Halarsenatibacter silvermanii TaxID=321763 RepID=A0A1G9JWA5_9FIRM|nr:tRNA (N(6)-L-threonylcarbamoyladenosine(37)-C(2))-methylthiotransferase MtaB [Halarsenatibacter silvermanii]SDL41566.1 threonylcarbamoyladenosine tRNA methylthiotransferase MtaB [Halarsenatibacter silvermanii]
MKVSDMRNQPRIAVYNLGCKVNEYEAEALIDQFRRAGYKPVDFSEAAEIYVINSCAVTTSAASKSRKMARRASRRGGENSIVIVAGCYSQSTPGEVEEIDEVDYLVGSSDKDRLVELIEEISADRSWLAPRKNYEKIDEYPELEVREVERRTRANIKIQDGCDQFCSYCIIPLARGKKRSREPESVLEEFERLKTQNVKEFILTGIHLGAYGDDFSDDRDHLQELLQQILGKKGDFRIRLSSLEALEVSRELVELIGESEKFCRHLHLPLQSGSNRVLSRMNRPYRVEDFTQKINMIRDIVPEIAITSDVMVGFPGETEEDFERTVKTVEKLEFSDIHVFSYSSRPGTKAASMSDEVDSRIKKERSKILRQLGKKLSRKYKKRFLKKTLRVLFEREKDGGSFSGYSDNYLRIRVESEKTLKNKFSKVKLKKLSSDEGELKGALIENP